MIHLKGNKTPASKNVGPASSKKPLTEDEKAAISVYKVAAGQITAQLAEIMGLMNTIANAGVMVKRAVPPAVAEVVARHWAVFKEEHTKISEVVQAASSSTENHNFIDPEKAKQAVAFLNSWIFKLSDQGPEAVKGFAAAINDLSGTPEFVNRLKLDRATVIKKYGEEKYNIAREGLQSIFLFLLRWAGVAERLVGVRMAAMKAWTEPPSMVDGVGELGADGLKFKIIRDQSANAYLEKIRGELATLVGTNSATFGGFVYDVVQTQLKKDETAGSDKGELRITPPGYTMVKGQNEAICIGKGSEAKLRRRKAVERMVRQHMKKLGVLRDDD